MLSNFFLIIKGGDSIRMENKDFEIILEQWTDETPLDEESYVGREIGKFFSGLNPFRKWDKNAAQRHLERTRMDEFERQQELRQAQYDLDTAHRNRVRYDPEAAVEDYKKSLASQGSSGTPQVTSNGVVTPQNINPQSAVDAATNSASGSNSGALFGGQTGGMIGGFTDAIKTGAKNVGNTLTKNNSPQIFAGTGGFTKAANAAMGAFVDFAKANPSITAALGLFGAYKLWKNRHKDRRYYSY